MKVRGRQIQFAGVFLDARLGIEVRDLKPAAGEQLRMGQRAQDGVLNAAVSDRIDEIAALDEFLFAVLPEVGDPEYCIALYGDRKSVV